MGSTSSSRQACIDIPPRLTSLSHVFRVYPVLVREIQVVLVILTIHVASSELGSIAPVIMREAPPRGSRRSNRNNDPGGAHATENAALPCHRATARRGRARRQSEVGQQIPMEGIRFLTHPAGVRVADFASAQAAYRVRAWCSNWSKARSTNRRCPPGSPRAEDRARAGGGQPCASFRG